MIFFLTVENQAARWCMLDKLVQQVILQEQDINGQPEDPDIRQIVINVEDMVKQ